MQPRHPFKRGWPTGNPGRFLHRIDPVAEQAEFVSTDSAALRDVAFLDGRTLFWSGSPRTFGLRQTLAEAGVPSTEPDRFIFHGSFCGSTLLATLLDRTAGAAVLKEPRALVDLADWGMTLDRGERYDPLFQPTLRVTRDLLRRPFHADRPMVIKPSNWVNSLVPRLCADPRTMKPLFITMDRRLFVSAVMRGGRDRLAFTARTAGHLAGMFTDGDALIADAAAASRDPLTRIVNLAVVAHHLQSVIFDRAMTAGGWNAGHTLDFSRIIDSPAAAVGQAAKALDVRLPDADLDRTVAACITTNAKQPDIGFSAQMRAAEDARVHAIYGPVIREAMAWGERSLPRPHTLLMAAA